ncbi:hypothetical protein V1238_10675 [Enterobacter hormaechei]|uniref:hypothetical protein n=1 Tax=Enterobacter hormaechei TaxID=158836 RepID=UPI00388F360B|nr:hypothetical protein V1237_08815 [Enterobacter hormaechei]WVJ12464.1 hypothetical protein V1238_10675 [Enterobacter hormaechei]
MSLLMPSRPIVINPDLAYSIGLNEAIALQQVNYWLKETTSGLERDGVRWIYNTNEQWLEQFPFWSESTLKRTFTRLKNLGVLKVEQLNKSQRDMTNYYTINYESELLDEVKVTKSKSSKCTLPSGQNEPMAESISEQCQKLLSGLAKGNGAEGGRTSAKPSRFCGAGCMAYSNHGISDEGETLRTGRNAVLDGSIANRLAHTDNEQHSISISRCGHEYVSTGRQQNPAALAGLSRDCGPLEVNGFWRDADWLLCRDGKWRPVEPGTFPLVDGAAARLGRVEPGVARVASSNRIGRLKGYGNAINAQAAAEFIRAYLEVV